MNHKASLILGDLIVIFMVTIIGFATHAEAGLGFLPRMAAVFLPLSLAWFLIGPWFGLYNSNITSDYRQLWRVAFAMLYAGPLAVVVRGLILNSPIVPVFAVVLSTVSVLGLIIWRAIYFLVRRQSR
jgi:flagellar biosynthesis protein FliQ